MATPRRSLSVAEPPVTVVPPPTPRSTPRASTSSDSVVLDVFYETGFEAISVASRTTVAEARTLLAHKVRCDSPKLHVLVLLSSRYPGAQYSGTTLDDHDVLLEVLAAARSKANRVKLVYHCVQYPLDIAGKFGADRCPDPALNTMSFTRLGQSLKAGFLFKRSSKDPRRIVWKRQYYVLHAKALMRYQGWDRGWKCIPLALCTAEALKTADHPDLVAQNARHVFQLESTHATYQFRVPSTLDVDNWMIHLQYAISTAHANNAIELSECMIADEANVGAQASAAAIEWLHAGGVEAALSHPLAAAALAAFAGQLGASRALLFVLDARCFAAIVANALGRYAPVAASSSSRCPRFVKRCLAHIGHLLLHNVQPLFAADSETFAGAKAGLRALGGDEDGDEHVMVQVSPEVGRALAPLVDCLLPTLAGVVYASFRDSPHYHRLCTLLALDVEASEYPLGGTPWYESQWAQCLPPDGGSTVSSAGARSASSTERHTSDASLSSVGLAFSRPPQLPDPLPLPSNAIKHILSTVSFVPPTATGEPPVPAARASDRTAGLGRACGFGVLLGVPPPAARKDSDGVEVDVDSPYTVAPEFSACFGLR